MAVRDADLARALQELIEALDRRVPHVERLGEASIARDAEALRDKARKRLAKLADNAKLVAGPRDPVR